jgi:Mg/Co/Ni transporter MgtE
MDTNVPTLSPDTDLLAAMDELAGTHMPAIAVVDQDRRLLGMLTEKDCLRILTVAAFHRPSGGRVSDYMSAVAHPVDPDMHLFQIAQIFLEGNFPTLPVVDRGRLVGCITRQHVLSGVSRLAAAEGGEQREMEASHEEIAKRPRSIEQLQTTFARYTREQVVRLLGRKS